MDKYMEVSPTLIRETYRIVRRIGDHDPLPVAPPCIDTYIHCSLSPLKTATIYFCVGRFDSHWMCTLLRDKPYTATNRFVSSFYIYLYVSWPSY